MTYPRMGEALVEAGVLDPTQVNGILEEQRRTRRPFGVIAEDLYDVHPEEIEEAWVRQYSRVAERVDPSACHVDDQAASVVSRRQAWQFRVLPLRFDGDTLVIATTVRHLRRAARFAAHVLEHPAYFVLAETEHLGEGLVMHYPLPGFTAHAVDDDGMEAVLRPLGAGASDTTAA